MGLVQKLEETMGTHGNLKQSASDMEKQVLLPDKYTSPDVIQQMSQKPRQEHVQTTRHRVVASPVPTPWQAALPLSQEEVAACAPAERTGTVRATRVGGQGNVGGQKRAQDDGQDGARAALQEAWKGVWIAGARHALESAQLSKDTQAIKGLFEDEQDFGLLASPPNLVSRGMEFRPVEDCEEFSPVEDSEEFNALQLHHNGQGVPGTNEGQNTGLTGSSSSWLL